MLSPRAIFEEIFDDDEAFRLFCSIAGSGEAQGGWENGRIAALVPASCADLASKIARHGADENRHSRMFASLLRRRGLEPVPVPAAADYTVLLERAGVGLAHERLSGNETLSDEDVITYLVHSRVTEQRASEQMQALVTFTEARPDIGRTFRAISDDEDRHLAYCNEELLRFAAAGHGDLVERALRATAVAEIAIYRDVSRATMAHLARILGWSRKRSAVLETGIRAVYLYERLGGWRRMVSLRPDPEEGTPRRSRRSPAPAVVPTGG